MALDTGIPVVRTDSVVWVLAPKACHFPLSPDTNNGRKIVTNAFFYNPTKRATQVATYGIPGGKRERCAGHAAPNMVDIFNRKCLVEGCLLRATFGQFM